MIFSEYKDILGKPNEGVHSYTFLGLAAFDLFGTLLIAFLINYYYYDSKNVYNTIKIFLYLFILGEFLHLLFGVETRFIKLFK